MFKLEVDVVFIVGALFVVTLTLKLSVVVVPNVFVNVITESIVSPLPVVEPLISNPTDKLPFELIEIAGFVL